MPTSPHSRCLRSGRFSEPGRIYLVTTATEKRHPIFSSFHLGRLVVEQLRRTEHEGLAVSLAWVLMPDHLHWLLELKTGSLDRLVKQVKASSAISINRITQRKGRIWQQGFHDRAMRYDEDPIKAARYIVANPLRAGLVERFGDYPLWDSVWL
ncbi:MAG: REP-associated tyrosine transposase [Pseudomonas sp.]|uniref:REP-associated tyrosine transposase n=1 Tax=Pseudomonas sp. TaxID=306 RepID=UPI003D6E5EAF